MFYEVGDEVSFEVFMCVELKTTEYHNAKIVAVQPAADPEDTLPDYVILHEGKTYTVAGLLVWVPYIEPETYDPLYDFNYVGSRHHY